jgi:hypothetical protein
MGSGTTGAVGRELGVNVISAEINPLLYKICEIKLQTCAAKDSKSFHLATEKLLEMPSNNWKMIDTNEEHPLLQKCYPLAYAFKRERRRLLASHSEWTFF